MNAEETQALASEKEDLGEVPDMVTQAGLEFFRQHILDLHLMTSETRVVGELEGIVTRVAKAVMPEREPGESFPTLYNSVDWAKAANRHNWAARKEIAVVRYVDNYLVYLSDLISLLLRSRPEALRSGEKVSLEDVLQHSSLDEFIEWMVEERVNRLSYKGFAEIGDFFDGRFGLRLVQEATARQNLVHAISKRNLLVHRRGVVDRRFLDSLQREGIDTSMYRLGSRITELGHWKVMTTVVGSVIDIEDRAVKKFGLPIEQTNPQQWWPEAVAETIGDKAPEFEDRTGGA